MTSGRESTRDFRRISLLPYLWWSCLVCCPTYDGVARSAALPYDGVARSAALPMMELLSLLPYLWWSCSVCCPTYDGVARSAALPMMELLGLLPYLWWSCSVCCPTYDGVVRSAALPMMELFFWALRCIRCRRNMKTLRMQRAIQRVTPIVAIIITMNQGSRKKEGPTSTGVWPAMTQNKKYHQI